jgi:lysophospholipase L1-like esterase
MADSRATVLTMRLFRSRTSRNQETTMSIETALQAGRRIGIEAANERTRQLSLTSTTRAPGMPRTLAATEMATPLPNAGAAARARGPAARCVVAEGDSWFDYPRSDVLDALEDDHDIRIEKVAQAGDTIEDMAFNPRQIGELARRYERLLRDQRQVNAVLISGGGNDITGDVFEMVLEHLHSGKPAVNATIARELIDVRVRDAYLRIIGTVMGLSEAYLGRQVPIIAHGYAYPVADGRGFMGGAWFLPGPWLSPGFDRKGIDDMSARRAVMRDLIDRFNLMLSGLAADPAVGAAFRYVDVRAVLSDELKADQYKRDWANELHPTPTAFRRVAAAIEAQIP